MQKTTLYGKAHTENTSRSESHPKNCPNCVKLQAQVTDLTRLLFDSQAALQNITSGSENELIKQVQGELLQLRQQYAALKKRVNQVEKENDELFAENTQLEKQLTIARNQLKEIETIRKEPQKVLSISIGTSTTVSNEEGEGEKKQKEVQRFVWQERVRQLQCVNKDQGQEIARLKQFLRKRNKQQSQRHKLLELFS